MKTFVLFCLRKQSTALQQVTFTSSPGTYSYTYKPIKVLTDSFFHLPFQCVCVNEVPIIRASLIVCNVKHTNYDKIKPTCFQLPLSVFHFKSTPTNVLVNVFLRFLNPISPGFFFEFLSLKCPPPPHRSLKVFTLSG